MLLSTAARFVPRALPANVCAVPLMRGELAARRASLVFCSGGASTAWQALAEGTPVVGMPSNLDACLAMSCIAARGAGLALRPGATIPQIRATVAEALRDPSLRAAARVVARSFAAFDPAARFTAVVDELLR